MRRYRGIVVVIASLAGALLTACSSTSPSPKPGKQARALFEERCSRFGGPKIYKRIEDVEGIMLLQGRPEVDDRDLVDRNYPGAALAAEASEDGLITSLLSYEHSPFLDKPVTPERRGHLTLDFQPRNASNVRGYAYVEAVDPHDGKRYRYSLADKSGPNTTKVAVGIFLRREKAEGPPPRYGVTYEYHLLPEERALGVASATIKVIDTHANELLGEYTQYVWGRGFKEKNPFADSWLSAQICPYRTGTSAGLTRQFADTVLIPKQGGERGKQ